MLLDMENDPHQLKNLAHDPKYADVAAKMSNLLKQYKASIFPRPRHHADSRRVCRRVAVGLHFGNTTLTPLPFSFPSGGFAHFV